jgi:hypothetical protein
MLVVDILKAAIKMASDDAASAAWVRTQEQIYGGGLGRPRKLSIFEDVGVFLLEHDIAASGPSSKQALDQAIQVEKARFQELPWKIKHVLTVNRAQIYNYTSLLELFTGCANLDTQTAQTLRLIQLACAEKRSYRWSSTEMQRTYQAPLACTASPTTLPKGEQLPDDLVAIGIDYSKAGRDISRRLVAFLVSQMDSRSESEGDFEKLYTIEKRIGYSDSDEYPKMNSSGAFISIARKARQWGWKMDDETAGWFITAISGRRKLRNWYDRLSKDDPRFQANHNHEAWLQTLVEVVVALAGHKNPAEDLGCAPS